MTTDEMRGSWPGVRWVRATTGSPSRAVGDNEAVTAAPTTEHPYEAPASAALMNRARTAIPGGVNSPVRAFRAVGGTPRFVAVGRGPYITDADGRTYVDLVSSWGALLHGHAHPAIVDAVRSTAANGTSYGAPTEVEVALAEEIIARTSVEQVRLVSSGTEATMSAVRLARGFTGRDLVVKFAGCYHGHVDALLASAGSGVVTFGLPGTPGVPTAATATTIVLAYNDSDAVAQVFAEHGDRIACVITEAAAGNMGAVPPLPGFNATLAATCRAHGALLISDEVMTGFRVHRQGWWGLDGAVEGWAPDLTTFGKVMGGGFPAAAFGGRAEVMARLAPDGPVYQAGTLSGNPVAVTAGLTALQLATAEVYAGLDRTAATIKALASDALTAAGVPHLAQSAGNMFSIFFGDPSRTAVVDFTGAQDQQLHRFSAFFHAMLAHGVWLPPSAYEAWFVNAALDEAAIDAVASALPHAARAAAQATPAAGNGTA